MSLRGEITVEHDGRSWRLVLDYNAFAWVEELLTPPAEERAAGLAGPTYGDLCREVAEGRLPARHARALIWAAAQRHQPDVTLQEAGDLLSAEPALIGRLFAAASPTPAEQDTMGN